MRRPPDATPDLSGGQCTTDGEPPDDNWLMVSPAPLSTTPAVAWVSQPACGAIVLFCGTVRDHSHGRPGVVALEYEAYVEQVVPRLGSVAASARRRWPGIGRIALAHRVGVLSVGDVSVVVAVSTPHRDEAFHSARFCIDTLKATVPIWKRETWASGTEWSACSHPIVSDDFDHIGTGDTQGLPPQPFDKAGLR